MSKIRIDDLAKELDIKSWAILGLLPVVGVTEKKTHLSFVEGDEAEKIRAYIHTHLEFPSGTWRSVDSDQIKSEIDSHISKLGYPKTIISTQQPTAAVSSPTGGETLKDESQTLSLPNRSGCPAVPQTPAKQVRPSVSGTADTPFVAAPHLFSGGHTISETQLPPEKSLAATPPSAARPPVTQSSPAARPPANPAPTTQPQGTQPRLILPQMGPRPVYKAPPQPIVASITRAATPEGRPATSLTSSAATPPITELSIAYPSSKVRINDLARELEVKSKAILDILPEIGVTEKKTHSSSLEKHEAVKARAHFRATSEAQTASWSSRSSRAEADEIKTKIDLSHISKPGDVLNAIRAKQAPAAPPTHPSPPAQAKPAAATSAAPAKAPVAPPPLPVAPQAPRVVMPPVPPTMTPTAPPSFSSEFKSPVASAVRPGSESGIALPTSGEPPRRPMFGGSPPAQAGGLAKDSRVTQCNRQHIIDIESEEPDTGSEELELEFKYQRREEGMTSSHPFPIPAHKVVLSEVKEFANALFHELQRLSTLADNRPPTLTELEKAAGQLYKKLIPTDLSEILRDETEFAYLVLQLPAELAWIPWELLWDPETKYFLCQAFKVSRHLKKTGIDFRRAESRRLEVRSGRALILFGDVSKPKLEAQKEKVEVERYFDQLFSNNVWFPLAKTRSDVLDWLKKDYDICHYIGHGKFVAEDPRQSGWVMRDGKVLTCTEIEENASKKTVFPLLIFANSCDSAHPAVANSEAYVHLLYHAFLRLGVPHYIGTITKVQDRYEDESGEEHYPAAEFARDFYRSLASGCRLGEALGIARREAFGKPGTPIWASYVHYGDPAFQFVEKPIAPQKVLKPRLERASLPAQPTYRDIFVDRFRELGLMREDLQVLAEDKFSILLITGEAGSGKSALLRRFVLEATHSLEPVGIATSACPKRARHDGHFLIREIFGQLVQSPSKLTQPQQGALTVGELVLSELLLFPQLVSLCRPDVILGTDRFHRICERLGWDLKRAPVAVVPVDELTINSELEQVLQRISEVVPFILAIEDLQWADESSLELFLRLCKSLAHSRVLLLGAYRSHAVQSSRSGTTLEDILPEARRYGARTMSLDRLTGSGDEHSKNSDHRRILSFVISYLRRVLPIVSAEQRVSRRLVDLLVGYTGGNAFFLAEIVQHLRRTNAIDVEWSMPYNVWDFNSITRTHSELPESVQGLIEDRIAELSPHLRQTLNIASVLGQTFSLEALAYLSGLDEATVIRHLDELIHVHRLVEELEETSRNIQCTLFHFRSRAVQAYVHDLNSLTLQRRLHKKAGEYLENLPSEDREEWASQIATHFLIAKEWLKAFRYAVQVGLSNQFDYDENIQHLQSALELLKRVPGEEHLRSRLNNELVQVSWYAEQRGIDCYFPKLSSLLDEEDY